MDYPSYPISISIPAETFHALVDHCGELYYGDKAETVVNQLILEWLQRETAGTAAVVSRETERTSVATPMTEDGYQWKRLFLPAGTRLRAQCRGAVRYARVEGTQLISQGQVTTPSRFANACGGGGRSAWRTLWIQFPGEAGWTPAGDHRLTSCRSASPERRGSC